MAQVAFSLSTRQFICRNANLTLITLTQLSRSIIDVIMMFNTYLTISRKVKWLDGNAPEITFLKPSNNIAKQTIFTATVFRTIKNISFTGIF